MVRFYVDYILQFLCPELADCIQHYVSYVSDFTQANTPVVIRHSFFFDADVYGTAKSLPLLPLKELDGVPILFGEPKIEQQGDTVVLYADIVASTFFLITRYEEIIRPNCRDKHGRFQGRESLPFRAGFIQRPVVEEYGELLRKCLRMAGIEVKEPQPHFSRVFLTHDVDLPWTKYTLSGAFKRFGGELMHQHRLIAYPFLNIVGRPEKDPFYTFKAIVNADKLVSSAESVYFIKSGGHCKPEDAEPYIRDKGWKRLQTLLDEAKATLGYHVSYEAGKDPAKIAEELNTLRCVTKRKIVYSRNHYLASREPAHYHDLINNGITDDFTMAYADVAGFRIGTCRPVKWIDPSSVAITELTLHPMTIMDVTLTEKQYMGLDKAGAQSYGDALIENVYKYGGELTLLWHNKEYSGDTNAVEWKNYIHFINQINNKF